MTALDQIAPYPRTEEAATAEALRTHLLAFAYTVFWAMPERPGGSLDAALVAQTCGVAHLLGRITDRDGPAVADEVARHLWREWQDIGALGWDLTRSLEEAGIRADDVIAAAVQADPQDGGDTRA
ncbi:hypothetical protein ACIBQ1_09570 [Nonomuraea sp. NPDC050153]|uniref:hypothetical protein n=1 Tax=Nonomuraea sp. NPDC050153 TaxID=3364359 RepID=UPI0037B8310F